MAELPLDNRTNDALRLAKESMSGPLSPQPSVASAKLPQSRVKRATVASISSQPRATTAQALKGYAYLKSHSSRSRSSNSPA